MLEQVPEKEKRERIKKIIEIQNKISLERNKEEEGKTLEILVEGESKNNAQYMSGRSRTNKLVIFPGDATMEGKIVEVTITRGELTHLFGKIFVERNVH